MNRLLSLHCRVWGWVTRDEAQGLSEYALILALIAVVAMVALSFLSGKVNGQLSTVARSL